MIEKQRGKEKERKKRIRRNIYVRLQSKEYKNERWKVKQKVSREEMDRKEDEMRKE